MAHLAIFNWGWLLGSLLLGLAMGWVAVVHRGRSLSRVALRRAGLAAAVLVVIALARLVPGGPGYWLDLGLVMFAVYLVGCAIGSWLRDRVVAAHASRSGA